MRSVLFSLVLVFTLSCGNKAVRKSFSGSDSLVIHFKDEQAGVVTKSVETAESKAIRKIIGFIDAAATENFNCGFDGKMFFYSKGEQVQEVDFMRGNDSCSHF